MAPPPKAWVAQKAPHHYRKTLPGDGADRVDVRLRVLKVDAGVTVAQLTERWRPKLETYVREPKGRTVKTEKLGGRPCATVDVRGVWEHGTIHVTWSVALHGKKAYVFWVQRFNEAVDDKDLAADVAKCRASVRLPVDAPAAKPKPEPRDVLRFKFWKLTCVKPAGMKLDHKRSFSETANQLVLKLTASKGQTFCMIRVYAHRRDLPGHRPLDELVAARLAYFEKTYERREKPEQGRRWKIPLVKKSHTLRLVGKRTTVQVTRWFLAECKNGCQYQVEIYAAGTGAEALYKSATDDFLKSFKPTRK